MAYPLVRWLYTALYGVLAPLVLALLSFRGDSRQRMREYLGGSPRPAPGALALTHGGPVVWLHAVSVGEALSALPVLESLRAQWPRMDVHLTSTIEDALVVALRSGAPFVSARFLPLDLPPLMDRVIDRLEPDLVLVSETDFWPNMLHVLARRGVPVFLVNGRISYKIAGLYSVLGGFSTRMFTSFARCFVQTELDAERLARFGVPPARIVVAGNTKYEASLRALPPGDHEDTVRQILTDARPRIVAGSTHAGEEELALASLKGASLAVVAPRDVRRAAAVVNIARTQGIEAVRFSDLAAKPEALLSSRCVVVDVLGVLPRLYEGARAAFIGGSFDGSGGHNFLEAARFAVPVVCGPKMRNFTDDVALFLEHGALVQAADAHGTIACLDAWLRDPDAARKVGEAGAEVLRAHRGAAARTADGIRAALASVATEAERA
jgi:3-deoxy-D-manno-octulosonic-acid transferase